jgi:probable rRNA maturation factor
MIVLDPDLDAVPQPASSRGARSSGPTPLANLAKTDRQNRVPSARSLMRFLREAQAAVRLRGQVTVLLTTDLGIRRLNRQFRGKNKPTDVLSFPAAPAMAREVAGDLAISVPTARRQASDQSHPVATEIKVLILHGLLHLAGYDHEIDDGRMARREQLLRTRLRLPRGLIERTEPATVRKKQPTSPRRSPSQRRPV